jgi:hypothetical protein
LTGRVKGLVRQGGKSALGLRSFSHGALNQQQNSGIKRILQVQTETLVAVILVPRYSWSFKMGFYFRPLHLTLPVMYTVHGFVFVPLLSIPASVGNASLLLPNLLPPLFIPESGIGIDVSDSAMAVLVYYVSFFHNSQIYIYTSYIHQSCKISKTLLYD